MDQIASVPDHPSVEERLDYLEMAERARSLLAGYAQACDAQDVEALARLFSATGRVEVPDRAFEGREAVLGFYRHAFASDPSRKSHFITNVETRRLGLGRVAVDSYFIYTASGDATSILGWGEYRDVVADGPEGVRFESKSIAVKRAVDVREGWAAT
jgi:3-phenylpropionate/cinnamic acid dioxygenase small subunit